MPRSPSGSGFHGLWLFVGAYVAVFAVAGLLLYSARVNVNDDAPIGPSVPKVASLRAGEEDDYHPATRKLIIERLKRAEEGHRWPYPDSELLNCSSLQEVSDLEFVAAGWTKAVYRGRLRGRDVAIKTVNLNGQDIRSCSGTGATLASCYRRAAAKVLRELVLLHELRHPNIVEVLGACVPGSPGPIAVVTELGDPLDTVRLLQLSWEDRLRLALGVARILHRLARSPLGSVAMNDFRRQQFVLVDGRLKLSDVDDVGVSEPTCETDSDCRLMLANSTSPALGAGVPCSGGRCRGYNERLNIWRAGRHFIRLFVPLSAPSSLEPHIHELLSAYAVDEPPSPLDRSHPWKSSPSSSSTWDAAVISNSTSPSELPVKPGPGPWDSARVLAATQRLVATFVSGEYFQPEVIATAQFERLPDKDLPGLFDYRCERSVSAVGCVRSVFDEQEAEALCSKDPACRAVVLGPEHTWTGRTLAVFKNGYDAPSSKRGYFLLLKKW